MCCFFICSSCRDTWYVNSSVKLRFHRAQDTAKVKKWQVIKTVTVPTVIATDYSNVRFWWRADSFYISWCTNCSVRAQDFAAGSRNGFGAREKNQIGRWEEVFVCYPWRSNERMLSDFSHNLSRQCIVFLNSEAVYHPIQYNINMAPSWLFSCMGLSGASSPDTAQIAEVLLVWRNMQLLDIVRVFCFDWVYRQNKSKNKQPGMKGILSSARIRFIHSFLPKRETSAIRSWASRLSDMAHPKVWRMISVLSVGCFSRLSYDSWSSCPRYTGSDEKHGRK